MNGTWAKFGDFIKSVGVPAAIAFLLIFRMEPVVRGLTEAVNYSTWVNSELRKAHEAAMAAREKDQERIVSRIESCCATCSACVPLRR